MSAPGMTMVFGPDVGQLAESDLGEVYPWPTSGRWVRGMMVATLDGGSIGPDGRSGTISSPVDRAVMAGVRRYCDAILIGAGTFRAERYRPQRPTEDVQVERRAVGLEPAPTMVLVSRSLNLPWEEDAFGESTIPPIVVTAESCDALALEVARRYVDVAVLPGERVAAADLFRLLGERGLDRIVCEGGPRLLAEIAGAGLLDELDLAVSPLMVGGGQRALGEPGQNPGRFHLVHVMVADDFLFTRYVRRGSSAEPPGGIA